MQNDSNIISPETKCVLESIQALVMLFRNDRTHAEAFRRIAAISAHGEPRELTDALRKLQASLPNSDSAAEFEKFLSQTAEEYVRLFVNKPGGIPAPPYESCYRGPKRQMMGPPAIAMENLLTEAGLQNDTAEPADHVATELEFAHFLITASLATGAAPVFAAEFATSTLAGWVDSFAADIAHAEPKGVFRHVAELLQAVVKSIGALQ